MLICLDAENVLNGVLNVRRSYTTQYSQCLELVLETAEYGSKIFSKNMVLTEIY